MSNELVGGLGFLVLLLLMALGAPVGIALLAVGVGGLIVVSGLVPTYYTLSGQAFEVASFYPLSVLPLFILMGNLAAASGMSRDLYDAAYRWIGHLRGGLAGATVIGCAGFSALSGSSIAAAVTMGKVSYPEMRRYAYGDRLATGAIAAGGTLGILIPPSTGFVLYAILTEQSIGRLFMAGVLPGLMLMGLFLVAIAIVTALRPDEGPPGERSNLADRQRATVRALGIVVIILLTIGGIYLGIFTPVEAAGVGAFFAYLVWIVRKGFSLAGHVALMRETLETTGMVFLILIGATVFSPFVAQTGLAEIVTDIVTASGLGVYGTFALIILIYAVLGMMIEGLSLMVVTLPIVFPIVTALGFDPIWFGVIMVIVLEMGLISPPVGVNCFVVKALDERIRLETVFAGVLPFLAAMVVAIALLTAFPEIALMLPNAMFDR